MGKGDVMFKTQPFGKQCGGVPPQYERLGLLSAQVCPFGKLARGIRAFFFVRVD